MKITEDIRYIGVNDREVDLFEGQYVVENGMAYNSYVITDEKIAVMDTVDARFGDEWLNNLKEVIGDKAPDYLVVQHMEPDHSANILLFADCFVSQGFHNDEAVLRQRFCGQTGCCGRRQSA